MFERANQFQGKLDILFGDDRGSEQIYLPFIVKDVDGLDNIYQSTSITQSRRLHIVVDVVRIVLDIHGE